MESISQQLKQARLQKGLSQKSLAQMAGLPQSHLSKIESGQIDLKTSTLTELARVLDLELMLVPRILVQTVETLQRGLTEEVSTQRPMYQLGEDDHEE